MANETIGDRIQKAREKRGFSASELARLVRVTPTAVWNWEKNGVQPRPEAQSALAKVLGVTTEYLITGEDEGRDDETQTPAVILENARIEIARLTGFALDSVNISVSFTTS